MDVRDSNFSCSDQRSALCLTRVVVRIHVEKMICESTNVFVDYLFGGEYFVNKLYIFIISMLLCIF